MKVLFAVSNEGISEAVINKYNKLNEVALEYKNVYFFNAIVKELERDNTYDAIIVDESLEEITGDQNDRMLLTSLNNITEVSFNTKKQRIPMILILKANRERGEKFLKEIYNLGILDALIGQERKISKICELINKSRTEKEAQENYNIEVTEQLKQEEIVPISEIKSILSYYRKLPGEGNEYSEAFDKISLQYSDYELIYILDKLTKKVFKNLSETNEKVKKLLENREEILSKKPEKLEKEVPLFEIENVKSKVVKKEEKEKENEDEDEETEEIKEQIEEIKEVEKIKETQEEKEEVSVEPVKEEIKQKKENEEEKTVEENEVETVETKEIEKEPDTKIEDIMFVDESTFEVEKELEKPKLENQEAKEFEKKIEEVIITPSQEVEYPQNMEFEQKTQVLNQIMGNPDFSSSRCSIFVGTSKNGVSFVVNSLGMLFSSIGINTAILDLTKNKNDYYIATSNEEHLRILASESIDKLRNGIANGLVVERNLTVYTAMPTNPDKYQDAHNILSTLLQNHELILIDADFDTPVEYFRYSKDIFAVQSLDVLTIQPLTEFLRKLKKENIINDEKIKVIINKEIPVKGLAKKSIVQGLSSYNSPSMSTIEKLFDKDRVKVFSIGFNMNVYQKYMENIAYCKFEIIGYPQSTIEELKIIANNIYPFINR